jgi:hypothetical protein
VESKRIEHREGVAVADDGEETPRPFLLIFFSFSVLDFLQQKGL